MQEGIREQALIDDFSRNRDQLIDRLELGELDKTDYIVENVRYFHSLDAEPFSTPYHTLEQGLFNYQYYNVMAKHELIRADELAFQDPESADDHRDRALRYYDEKDRGLLHLLEAAGYHRIEAYFVKTDSPSLRGQLYEIVIQDYPRAIFHSKSTLILKRLKHRNVFCEETKPSLIDAYINTKY